MTSTAPSQMRSKPGLLGLSILGIWVAGGVALVVYLVSVFNPSFIAAYGPAYLSGLRVTITLVAISYTLGALLSVPLAAGRLSSNRIARGMSGVYVTFFRGTPFLAQIFLIYYGLGSFRAEIEMVGLWWFFREAWYCAILAMTLNTAAYQAEILRGAIESVPAGQWEGAKSLALSKATTLRRIILPQALIVALRPYANELILMIKTSAVVAIITVFDLFGETRRAFSKTFDFQTYIWAAVFYLVLVEVLRHLTDWIERRATRHLQR
ncbi:amino acid ABC transporter membrane protein 2, PAAT family [Aureimonas jatrophae]|jgi:polar amino acid transport system permease protein|uniref:Amino acid ABC transporter membrane protein 2, PAAT family n=2 Tax=Aureimonas jatrophae TaxID=1166073 RepID=A0A1H0GE59_9HYPH|nr:amino acid ABC transporter membrane protein 2, PAAT family [Aureimonas jatrophae]